MSAHTHELDELGFDELVRQEATELPARRLMQVVIPGPVVDVDVNVGDVNVDVDVPVDVDLNAPLVDVDGPVVVVVDVA